MASEEDVRRIALSLPEVVERPWYGTPGWRVKGRGFARLREDPDALVVFVADEEDKQALIAGEPEKYFTTPHYDGWPIVLVRLPSIDERELRELLVDAWRVKAPKRVLAEHGDALG